MAKEKLTDRSGRTMGYVESSLNGTAKIYDAHNSRIGEIKPQGKQLIAYNKMNQKFAYWDETRNTTFDKAGHKIGSGNLLVSLYFQ